MNTVTMATVFLGYRELRKQRKCYKSLFFHGFASNFALWCKMVVAR